MQGAIVAKGKSEELERADIVALDVSALKCWLVNMLGLNATLADLETTALKSVVDLFVVIAAGVCLAWLAAAAAETGRELIRGILEPRPCFFV